jgi:hypothetical protein
VRWVSVERKLITGTLERRVRKADVYASFSSSRWGGFDPWCNLGFKLFTNKVPNFHALL